MTQPEPTGAWREYNENESRFPEGRRALDSHSAFDAGWDFARQYDEQRIAALVEAAIFEYIAGYVAGSKVSAAPYEPSDTEVELLHSRMRAALRAAWGGEARS